MADEPAPDEAPLADISALDPAEIDVGAIQREEQLASRKLAAIEAGRRKGGLVGAAMAGAMLTLQEIYEGPPHDADIVVVSESPDELGDIDEEGIEVSVGDVDVWAPPPVSDQPPADGI